MSWNIKLGEEVDKRIAIFEEMILVVSEHFNCKPDISTIGDGLASSVIRVGFPGTGYCLALVKELSVAGVMRKPVDAKFYPKNAIDILLASGKITRQDFEEASQIQKIMNNPENKTTEGIAAKLSHLISGGVLRENAFMRSQRTSEIAAELAVNLPTTPEGLEKLIEHLKTLK